MKLIQYEFIKLSYKKPLLFFVVILFGLNCFLFWNEQKDSSFQNDDTYKELQSYYTQRNPQIALKEITNQTKYIDLIKMIQLQRDKGIDDVVIQSSIEPVLNAIPNPVSYDELINRYSEYFGNEKRLDYLMKANYALERELNHILAYPIFVNSIEEKANDMHSVSIFNSKNSFAYRNIQKTVVDFNDLKSVTLSLGQEEGILAVSTFKLTDYFLLALIILLCVYLFSEEKENGVLNLIQSTKNGRFQLAISKIAVIVFLTIRFGVLFYCSNFFIADKIYGFGDINRLIQSMSGFRDADIPMTVKDYFILSGIIKLLSLILFAILLH